jgi:Domain of unknown function (DUF5655)/Domain of unknown function (DUF4287)
VTYTYDPHPGIAMVRNWIDSLKEKSGRSLDEWVALVKKKGPSGTNERREWLKNEHALGTNSASWIVDVVEGTADEMGDADEYLRLAPKYVEAMFAGPKAALLPAYERLYALARTLDVKISPGKTIVPIYRKHVIAQIKPSTRTRIDFGLALKNAPAKGRLIDTGGLAKKDRITHRIEITSPSDVDAFVEKWLRRAYDMDG